MCYFFKHIVYLRLSSGGAHSVLRRVSAVLKENILQERAALCGKHIFLCLGRAALRFCNASVHRGELVLCAHDIKVQGDEAGASYACAFAFVQPRRDLYLQVPYVLLREHHLLFYLFIYRACMYMREIFLIQITKIVIFSTNWS